jgi:predicted transcriptional regulator
MTDPTAAMAATVRAHLHRRGIRQTDVAPVLGLSQPSVSDRLTGKTPFTLVDLQRLAANLGITVAELMTEPTGADS